MTDCILPFLLLCSSWMKSFKRNEDQVIRWGNAGLLLASISLCSSAAAFVLASLTSRQIRNLTVQTIKGCSSALGTTQLVLLCWGLNQYAYTLTLETRRWMAFLSAVFARPRAIKNATCWKRFVPALLVTFELGFWKLPVSTWHWCQETFRAHLYSSNHGRTYAEEQIPDNKFAFQWAPPNSF